MARTASDDIRVKGFGLAGWLLVESLFDRLIPAGKIAPAELQILYLDAMQKCAVHEQPASPWVDEAVQAHDILDKGKAMAQQLYGP
jgi:hypothetical protein